MVTVSLKFDSSIMKRLDIRDKVIKVKVEEGTSIKELFDEIGIIPGEVGIIKLNGKIVNIENSLWKDCIIQAFSIFGGG